MRTKLRLSILTALLLTTSTAVVMASSTACRVVIFQQVRLARAATHRRVHHSAATLVRWKIGAAAWSKTHGGKVYAGVPVLVQTDWQPMHFTCDDVVALDLSRPDEGLLIASEAAPEFSSYSDWLTAGSPGFDLTSANGPDQATAEEASLSGGERLFNATPFGGGNAGGGGFDAPVGPASFPPLPPGPVPPVLAGAVPTPEPPTVMLLATGMLSFLVSKLRRRTVV